MKHTIFTCLAVVMLIAAALCAGCASEKKIQSLPTPVPVGQEPGRTSPGQTVTVPYGEEMKISLDSPATSEVYLTMTARANTKELGGGQPYLRLKVNGKEILPERLVNKNVNFTFGDGFKASYYSRNMSAWYLFFSPDYTGYDNPKFSDRVVEGNAYVYKFDVSDIVNKGAPNEVLLEHIGDEVAAKYSKPSDVEFYKSAPILIDPIKLEGKGTDVVQVTKEATPTRIIVGKKSVVTLKVTNDLPGSMTDVEIADADIPSGLSGKTVAGKLEKPIASHETYTVSYEITADRTGTYNLGTATVTFADATGNYQKMYSNMVTVTVI